MPVIPRSRPPDGQPDRRSGVERRSRPTQRLHEDLEQRVKPARRTDDWPPALQRYSAQVAAGPLGVDQPVPGYGRGGPGPLVVGGGNIERVDPTIDQIVDIGCPRGLEANGFAHDLYLERDVQSNRLMTRTDILICRRCGNSTTKIGGFE